MDLRSDGLTLEDGARVAILGGGPAGSFFAYFLLELAEQAGKQIEALDPWRETGTRLLMKAYAQANDLPVDNFYAAKSAYARGLTHSKRAVALSDPRVTLLPVQVAPRAQSSAMHIPSSAPAPPSASTRRSSYCCFSSATTDVRR